ncbi:MAG: hypothetical protein LBT35_06810 [Tannerella sp.]|nr:hypothetical protein [Tannerella sp.]
MSGRCGRPKRYHEIAAIMKGERRSPLRYTQSRMNAGRPPIPLYDLNYGISAQHF